MNSIVLNGSRIIEEATMGCVAYGIALQKLAENSIGVAVVFAIAIVAVAYIRGMVKVRGQGK